MHEINQFCSDPDCLSKDFVPFKCVYCKLIFCTSHYDISDHNCYVAPVMCKVEGCSTVLTFNNSYICKLCNLKVCLRHKFRDTHNCDPPNNQ